MEEALKELDLRIVQSDYEDRMPIDFTIRDDHDMLCAEVWGRTPDDVEIACEHPAVEFEDDEHVGECPVCGAWATWHWEEYSDDGYPCREKIIDTWDYQDVPGGILGKYLKDLQENGNESV